MSLSRASVVGAACETATGGRDHNQDRCEVLTLDPAASLWGFRAALVVADGMGGHEKGDQAAEIAVGAAEEVLAARLEDHAKFATGFGGAEPADVVRGAFERANERIYAWAVAEDVSGNTGTTLTVIACTDEEVVVGNVGDSRAYVVTQGRARKLSEEHSWVGQQVKLGHLTEAEAAVSPLRNQLTQAVGCDPVVDPHLLTLPLEAESVYMACTDGLTEVVDAEAIGEVIQAGGSPEDFCRALVALAVAAGTSDNVSVAVLATGPAEADAAEPAEAPEPVPEPEPQAPPDAETVLVVEAAAEPVAETPEAAPPEPEPDAEADEASVDNEPAPGGEGGSAVARQRNQRLGMALIVCVVSLLLGVLVGRATVSTEEPAPAPVVAPAVEGTVPPTPTPPAQTAPTSQVAEGSEAAGVVVRAKCEGQDLIVTCTEDLTLDVYPKGKYRDDAARVSGSQGATPGETRYSLPDVPASWDGQTVTLKIDRVSAGTLSITLAPEAEVFVDQMPYAGDQLQSVKPERSRARIGFYFPSGDDDQAYAIAVVGFPVEG